MPGVRVTVRPYELTDAEPLFDALMASREEIARWMGWLHHDYSLSDTEAWVSGQVDAFSVGSAYEHVIVDSDGVIIGSIGLNGIEHLNRRANLGYWMRTDLSGRGFTTKAAKSLLRWAFANTNLERIEIVAAVDNIGSCRVAERLGAAREATMRKRLRIGDAMVDAALYALVRTDDGWA